MSQSLYMVLGRQDVKGRFHFVQIVQRGTSGKSPIQVLNPSAKRRVSCLAKISVDIGKRIKNLFNKRKCFFTQNVHHWKAVSQSIIFEVS